MKKKKKIQADLEKQERKTAEERAVSGFQNSHLESSGVCFQQQKRQTYLQGGSWKYTSAPHPGGSLGKKSSAPRPTGTSAGASPGRSTGGHREVFRVVCSCVSGGFLMGCQQHQRLVWSHTAAQRHSRAEAPHRGSGSGARGRG